MNTEYETKTELQKTLLAALKDSGFQVGERIEVRALESVVVVVKEKMNASELISAVCQLEQFRGAWISYLRSAVNTWRNSL